MRKQQQDARTSRRVPTADGAPDTHPPSITVDEMIATYPGQWILMQVTAFTDGWPSAGRLLAHSDSYDEVSRARAEVWRDVNPADGPLYVFDAYPLIRTGEELRRALEEAQLPDADPFRWPRV